MSHHKPNPGLHGRRRVAQALVASICRLYLVAGCIAAVHAQESTIRICDPAGCSERARSTLRAEQAPEGASEESPPMADLVLLAKRDAHAAFDLGLRLLRGDGVSQDSFQALRWLRQAAERGVLPAQVLLGQLYLNGLQEMGPDPMEAERWLSIAAARGDRTAGHWLAKARQDKSDEHARYQWRDMRRDGGHSAWLEGHVYFWVWRDGWLLKP